MDAAWPLVDRAPQLRRIAEAVRRPGIRALVVTGTAGSGKTRLAVEALRDLRRHRVRTHWLVATQAATHLPLAAVAHLIPDVPASAAPVELLAHARRTLERQGEGRRVILGVDDAHLLDDGSAALIGHLAAVGTAFVLCTVRAGEALPGPVRGLLDSGEGTSLTLKHLSRDAAADVLAQALGGQVDSAATHRLMRLSDGNPLLLRELFDDARACGAFRSVGALWRLDDDWSPPARLPDLVGARVSGLQGEALEAAQALALAEPLEVALFEAAFGAGAVADLDDDRLLDVVPDPRRAVVRPVHPLYAEVLRGRTTPLRARALYRRLAQVLHRTGARRRGDELRLASWWLAAGENGDATTFVTAARQAHASFDHTLAERLARAALQSGGGLGAALALADALRWQGRSAEAESVLADFTAGPNDEPAARIALIGLYGAATSDATDVDELLDKAEAVVTDARALDQITALRADIAVGQWRPREAISLLQPLLDRRAAEADQMVMTYETAAAAFVISGRTRQALDMVGSALDLIEQGVAETMSVLAGPLLAERAAATLLSGEVQRGRAIASDAYATALDRGFSAPRAWYGMLIGFADLLSGAVPDALPWMREANELMRAHPGAQGRHVRVWGLGLVAEASALTGDVSAARDALAEADGLLDPSVPVIPRSLGRAWTAAAAGDVRTASALLHDAARTAHAVGAHAHEALAWHGLARLAADQQDVSASAARLSELVELTDGSMVPALAADAAARAVVDVLGLEKSSLTLAELGLLGWAGETAEQALRASGRRQPESPLTPREREIASLAADGRSSRQIADLLVISVRTVDNHLHHIYSKLGITRREELPRLNFVPPAQERP